MNVPYKPESVKIPDLLLSGEAIGHILSALNNSVLFAKVQDGTMRPFVDPAPIINILQSAINNANNGDTS